MMAYFRLSPPQSIQNETMGLNATRMEYFITFLAICISGNPIIINGTKWYGIISLVIMIVLYLAYRRPLINLSISKWIAGFIFLFALQGIALPSSSISAGINFIAKLYAIFLMVTFVGGKFRKLYFNILYFISAISLICLTLNHVGLNIGIQFDKYRTVFIYNSFMHFETSHEFRNCGMFWEPGAFQGYIMLAFLFYINDYKLLWSTQRNKCIILSLALLSTFSTTGYIVFFLYIAYIVYSSQLNYYIKTLVTSLMLVCCVYSYYNFDFLGEKIEGQYENAMKLGTNEVSWSRMGAMKIDLQQISRHPIVGNGFLMTSRYEKLGEKMAGSGNGFTGAINILGIPCIALYLIALYKSLTFRKRHEKVFFVSVIIILLNGEFFLNYPLFWGLPFISIPHND